MDNSKLINTVHTRTYITSKVRLIRRNKNYYILKSRPQNPLFLWSAQRSRALAKPDFSQIWLACKTKKREKTSQVKSRQEKTSTLCKLENKVWPVFVFSALRVRITGSAWHEMYTWVNYPSIYAHVQWRPTARWHKYRNTSVLVHHVIQRIYKNPAQQVRYHVTLLDNRKRS